MSLSDEGWQGLSWDTCCWLFTMFHLNELFGDYRERWKNYNRLGYSGGRLLDEVTVVVVSEMDVSTITIVIVRALDLHICSRNG